jgi:hypothetical protein
MVSDGKSRFRCETGVVANVNPQNMTIDWVSQHSGRQIAGVQIMAPYLHYNNGEGFTVVPEVGAVCVLCWPSDDESPFVMGFLTAPEASAVDSGSTNAQEEPTGTQETALVSTPKVSTSGGTTQERVSDASYRSKRPVLNPGDMLWQGRDENFVVMRRGGVLQIGSTNICQRAYIPLGNYIRDFCENYELNTAAGTMSWVVHPSETTPDADAPTQFMLVAREFAQDKMASVKVSVGSLIKSTHLPSDAVPFIEVVVSPDNVNPIDGTTQSEKFILRIGRDGTTYTMQGDRKVEITGTDTLTVDGTQSITVTKDRELIVQGALTETIKKDHTITGNEGSAETWAKIKSITASSLKLGGADASEPGVLGLQLLNWLATHTHVPNGPPIQAGALASILAKIVYLK